MMTMSSWSVPCELNPLGVSTPVIWNGTFLMRKTWPTTSSLPTICAAPAGANAARGRAAGKNEDHVFAETGDLRLDLRLRAVPDAYHRDDRANADDDTERRQRGAQFVSAQRSGRDLEGGPEPNAPG